MIVASHGIIGSSIVQIPPVFLLDDYPNAAAAYSLRKLRGAYTGSAIRVRRASDSTELDIGFSANQLDTSALTTFANGGNVFVKTWYDQSGNAKNATQATAANQPQIVSSGSVILENGKPVIRFNVTNGLLVDNRLKTTSFTLIQPTHIFNANKFTSLIGTPSSPRTLFDGISSDSALMREDGTRFEIYSGSFLYINSVGRNTNNGLINVLFKGASSTYRYNGSLIVSGNAGLTSMNGITIGGDSGSNRTAPAANREVIVYASDQSTNQIAIENNINDFYGIY